MSNYKYIPRIGDKYGQWTIISTEIKSGNQIKGNKDRTSYWKVRCSCGKESWRNSNSLMANKTNSCKSCSKTNKYNTFALSYFKRIERRAKSIGVEFNLTVEYLWGLYEDQHRKCALSGLDIEFTNGWATKNKQTCSLDRIDNENGYVIGNVQWVHKDVNFMKGDFDQLYFIHVCSLIGKCG